MKIGIDAHSAEREGSGNCTYIQNYLKALSEVDCINEYVLYVNNIEHPFYNIVNGKKNFKLRQLVPKNPMIRIPFSLSKATFRDNIDILHVQYIAPPYHCGHAVVVIHDLCFLHFPECFSMFERVRSKYLVRLSAMKASKILTGSSYSKKDIMMDLSVESKKTKVIYYGVDPLFKPINRLKARQKISHKYGIDSKFILSLGRLNVRKNIERLIQAYLLLKQNKKTELKLVIVGKKDYLPESLTKKINELNVSREVIMLGYVPDDDLPSLFSAAEVFVYPSLFEGFGLPVLEAMACGCPIVASNSSSIPEVLGDAGLLVDPYKVKDIYKAIEKVISNSHLRSALVEKGLERAKSFTWRETARKTIKIYEEVMST